MMPSLPGGSGEPDRRDGWSCPSRETLMKDREDMVSGGAYESH